MFNIKVCTKRQRCDPNLDGVSTYYFVSLHTMLASNQADEPLIPLSFYV